MKSIKFYTVCAFFSLLLFSTQVRVNASEPSLLSYEELLELYENQEPATGIQAKLKTLLTTPFVSTRKSVPGEKIEKKFSHLLGPHLKVLFWNIERGIQYRAIEAAFKGPQALGAVLKENGLMDSNRIDQILEEARTLSEADIIVLNEVDCGVTRSGYRNVAADLATALNMNFAYGVEFIEVDPFSLGIKESKRPSEIDRKRYMGLHGNAILSRFPLENVRLMPYKFQPYDWYIEGKKGVSKLESAKRKVGEIAFQEKTEFHVRRGGRTILMADIVDSELPQGRVTVVATHLENHTTPRNRFKQISELLEKVKNINNPVILAGDMNTTSRDSTPTSVKREVINRLKSRSYMLKKGIKYTTGFEMPFGIIGSGVNQYRKQADPTVKHIPWIAPNDESKLFNLLRDFRFNDGGSFDFRGDVERSVNGNAGTLSNSNQRGGKGFVTTFEVERRIGFVGKFKLDWIFVKPQAGISQKLSYRFSPHFGRTLKELNYSLPGRISDHSPIIVDLPLFEPPIKSNN
jgi:endonuclease/exonuclease/phosphatase family metal-dependent hydrolase